MTATTRTVKRVLLVVDDDLFLPFPQLLVKLWVPPTARHGEDSTPSGERTNTERRYSATRPALEQREPAPTGTRLQLAAAKTY